MKNVVQLREFKNRDLVDTMRELLALAEAGHIEGHCFVVKLGAGDHRAGVTGDYKRAPAEALQATFLMERFLMGPPATRFKKPT